MLEDTTAIIGWPGSTFFSGNTSEVSDLYRWCRYLQKQGIDFAMCDLKASYHPCSEYTSITITNQQSNRALLLYFSPSGILLRTEIK